MSDGRMNESSRDKQVTDGDAPRWPQGAEWAFPRALVLAQQQIKKKDVGGGDGAGMTTGRERDSWNERF